jgi:N,N'-diacetylchitobiose phosphorylase
MSVEDPVAVAPVVASNGLYRCLLSPMGTGFSSYGDHQLTSWTADPCEDELGFYIYVRDPAAGVVATACGLPLGHASSGTWSSDPTGAEIQRQHGDLETRVRLEVLSEAPVERRIVRLQNRGSASRTVELTAYVEVVLNHSAAHAAHPGFSKLFVETIRDPASGLLIAARRPRANDERHPCLALALHGAPALEWETDRSRFLGRGRRPTAPLAFASAAPLSGRVGAVLDPVLALRTRIELAPGAATELCFLLAVGEERAHLPGLVELGRTASALAPVSPLASTQVSQLAPALAALFDSYARAVGVPAAAKAARHGRRTSSASPVPADTDNGFGTFTADGREYRIVLTRERDGSLRLPPMPWSNVLANDGFGCVVTEKGAASTWSMNSRLHRLTPWRNDALADPHDEALYLRDENSGAFWSVLPGPAPVAEQYEVRHGFGYSRWRHRSEGLDHDVTLFVADTDPLRIADVCLTNTGRSPRRLAFYAFNRWVLGASPEETRGSLDVAFDGTRGIVLARNAASGVFAGRVAFAALGGVDPDRVQGSTDRAAFLGVPGTADAPRAVTCGGTLPSGTAMDAAILRVELTLAAGASARLQALLGEADSADALARILDAHRAPAAAERELARVTSAWSARLGRTQVSTPVAAIDLMVNGWLLYQTIACRLWARTAFYQSGGAFGFRDQLQDAAALAQIHPEFLRAQLLMNAAHQFPEGDVLHWWHPPQSEGIRTRFADDLVWLPYLTARYVAVTGDAAVLDLAVGYKSGPALDPGEDERYIVPAEAELQSDVYTHCLRAFDHSMTRGPHGLPLFGCGDWNDGMNRVGREGRGESVWMAFFLYTAIDEFLPLCRARGDEAVVARLTDYQAGLQAALESAGWDGAWYRRGYYDNGVPLGSHLSDECQIDALVQAWAVISKAVPVARANAALDAAERRLISEGEGIIRLLTPPFDSTVQDPGYIKGYLAGVRENGGQYTHAALWLVKAMAEAGRRDRAAALLEMLSPVTHAANAERVAVYQVEPYVIAADVYGVAPHVGRGGWTWYTGSAGWMYRVAVESILGFEIEGGRVLRLNPRIPDTWPGFELTHRRPDGTSYLVSVQNPTGHAAGVVAATLDGQPLEPGADGVRVPFALDGGQHRVRVVLGAIGGRS